MSDELVEWSHDIADACRGTGLRPEQVAEACRVFSGATCPGCGAKTETGWAYCPECAEWKEV